MKRIICWLFGCDDKIISVADDALMGILLDQVEVTTYQCKRCGRVICLGNGNITFTTRRID